MSDESSVVIGVSFSGDLDEVDDAGNLIFSGAALEAGVWTDAHGNTAYFPAEVISNAASIFEGVDILCEHQGIPIGRVLETEATPDGFRVKRGIIFSKRMIDRVLEKKLRGLSIHADVRIDPVRKVVLEIFGAEEISLVRDPACKVCMLEEYELQDGGVTAVEGTLKEYEVYPEPDCEQFSKTPEIYEACKKFAKAVETFRKAQDEWHSMFADQDNKENAKMSANIEEVEAEVEVETEDETIEVEAAAETEVEIETDDVEVEVEASAESTDQVKDLEAKLAASEIEIADYRAQVSVLTARLRALEADARSKLEAAVMSADPNADTEFIAEMSTPALQKYLDTVVRLSKPTVGATKKSVKKEEGTVALSSESKKTTKTDAVDPLEIIQLLKTKQ